MCIDLHLHSLYSDGSKTPATLIQLAVESGLRGIALTDHDTVEGIEEFLTAGQNHQIELLSGLEVSAVHREFTMHILGYGFDHTNPELVKWLARLQDGRIDRNKKIIEKLQKMGHKIDYNELKSVSHCGQTGRPHIAQLLVQKKIVQSADDAFTHFLKKNGPAFAERFAYTAAESIEMIHQAGGIAVLAHPVFLEQQTPALSLVVAELVERGLDGIEAYYPSHSRTLQNKLCSLASKYHLVLTGGSDYHGNRRTFSTMAGSKNGLCPPDSLLGPIKQRIQKRTKKM